MIRITAMMYNRLRIVRVCFHEYSRKNVASSGKGGLGPFSVEEAANGWGFGYKSLQGFPMALFSLLCSKSG